MRLDPRWSLPLLAAALVFWVAGSSCVPVSVDLASGTLKVGSSTKSPPALVTIQPLVTGTYGVGGWMDIALIYNSEVEVTGTPRLELTLGTQTRHAEYLLGTGTYAIVFRYVPVAGDYDEDGVAVSRTLDLNGGTMIGTQSRREVSTSLPVADLSAVLVNTLDSQRIGHWAMDETGANTAGGTLDFWDMSFYGNHASEVGTVTYGAPGQVDQAVSLSGTSYVSVDSVAGFLDGVATVALWMNWNGGLGAGFAIPFGFNRYSLAIHGPTDSIGFNTANGDVHGVAGTAGFQGRWTHVIAEFHQGSVIGNRLWIDGAEQALTQKAAAANLTLATLATQFGIGNWRNSTTHTFQGSIDDVQVWRRSLSADEIEGIAP